MNQEINNIKNILSKYKYVYRIYKENNTFHIEQYPIVYSNSDYVYYKTGRKNTLNFIDINNRFHKVLKESFNDAIEYLNTKQYTWWYPSSVYFIETEKVKEHDLSLIKQELKNQSKDSLIKEQEEKVEKAKKNYEHELKKLKEMSE